MSHLVKMSPEVFIITCSNINMLKLRSHHTSDCMSSSHGNVCDATCYHGNMSHVYLPNIPVSLSRDHGVPPSCDHKSPW